MDGKSCYMVMLSFCMVCSCRQTVNTPAPEDRFAVSGTVTDGANHNLIDGAVVVINGESDTTGVDGKYEIDNISKGRHAIKVTHAKYHEANRTISVDKDTVIDVELAPVITVPPRLSIDGRVSDKVTGEDIEGAVVGLGNQSEITDAEGRFEFNNLDEGVYRLAVEHRFYGPRDTLLALDRDLAIHLFLDPIVGDYFPIDPGSTWKFQYSSYWYPPGHDGTIVEAEDLWEVVDKFGRDTLTVYAINRKLNGIQYKKGFWTGVPYDTTQIVDQLSSFEILEGSNGIVHIDLYGTMQYPIIYDFPRLNPVSIGDTLSVTGPPYSKARFVKSVGLIYYEWYWSSNTKIGYQSFLIESH